MAQIVLFNQQPIALLLQWSYLGIASDCLVRCFCCCLCREREKNTPRIAFRFPWRTSSAWTPSTLTPSSRRQARHALMLSICRKNGHYWRSCALNYREQAGIWGTHAHKPEPSPLATCPYRKLKCILLQGSLFLAYLNSLDAHELYLVIISILLQS